MSAAPPDTVIKDPESASPVWPTIYAGAIIVAALYFGRDLLIPLVMASLFAFVMAPACKLLQRLGVPRLLAVAVVVLAASGVIGGFGVVVSHQAESLGDNLPTYQNSVVSKWQSLARGGGFFGWLTKGVVASTEPEIGDGKTPKPGSAGALIAGPAPSFTIVRWLAENVLAPFLGVAGLVFIFTIFILISTESLRDRLVRLVGRHDLHRTILAMNDAASRLSRYFLFQLLLNTAFGIAVGTALSIIGLPNALLWGMLAGLMRFVPFVGVFIALIPPALLAVAVGSDWSMVLLVTGILLGGELIMGQVVEPLIYGHSTGLSPIAVIVATGFWTVIWGPVGLLMATPLTVCLVVIGRHVEAMSFLDVLLGDTPPLKPFETFYQRALEGSAKSLAPLAKKSVAASSLTDYYDKVALPGLALAQADLARDALGFERLESIHGQIAILLDELGVAPNSKTLPALAAPPPPAWQADGAIVCIAARGQLDDLAAVMAAQTLAANGFNARLEANSVFSASNQNGQMFAATRLCCLSALEQGSSVAGIRYFVRRMQKLAPNAAIVIGLWHAQRDSALLGALREEGGDEHIVFSVGELVALAKASAARQPEKQAGRTTQNTPLDSAVVGGT